MYFPRRINGEEFECGIQTRKSLSTRLNFFLSFSATQCSAMKIPMDFSFTENSTIKAFLFSEFLEKHLRVLLRFLFRIFFEQMVNI